MTRPSTGPRSPPAPRRRPSAGTELFHVIPAFRYAVEEAAPVGEEPFRVFTRGRIRRLSAKCIMPAYLPLPPERVRKSLLRAARP